MTWVNATQRWLARWLSIETLSAVGTCGIVGAVSLYFMYQNQLLTPLNTSVIVLLYLGFIGMWRVAIDNDPVITQRTRIILIALQFLSVIGIYWHVPFAFSAILMTIWNSQLPYFMSIRRAFILSPLWSLPLYLIYRFHWEQEYILVSAILFWTFNIFALVMVNATRKAEQAQAREVELNRQLMATQSLLTEAGKQAERVRIARNIHDLLGHHLTALTINLQVAARSLEQTSNDQTANDAVKAQIDTCHHLAKLLLSDVREAVSEIREKSAVDLHQTLVGLGDLLPNLTMQITIDDSVNITDVKLADSIVRCVQESLTNAVRHGNATQFTLSLIQQDGALKVSMQDNGHVTQDWQPGNGLLGIKERISQWQGVVTFAANTQGFTTEISLPVVNA